MDVACTFCSLEVEDGLRCDRCQKLYHFKCGTGLSNVSEDSVSKFLTDCIFSCPLCQVGTSNTLIHAALTANQLFNEEKHTTDFKLSKSFENQVTDTHNNDAESSICEEDKSLADGGTSTTPLTPLIVPGQPPTRTRVDTENSSVASFRDVVSESEMRRVKRCKGMLYGLKHMSVNVETLLVLDSNGRSIKAEDIDGERVCLRQIGGLCVAATTCALNQCKLKYPKIKIVAYGLGTNDHLHAKEHPGERTEFIKDLDQATKKVFPNAKVNFILPFTAIDKLGSEYVQGLAASISTAGVGWKIHQTPSMRGKLTAPRKIHLTPAGRVIFTLWLRKIFAPHKSAVTSTAVNTNLPSVPHSESKIVDSQHVSTYASAAAKVCGREPNTADLTRVSHPSLLETGEYRYNSVDLLLRDRLYELVMGSHSSLRQSSNRPRWAEY